MNLEDSTKFYKYEVRGSADVVLLNTKLLTECPWIRRAGYCPLWRKFTLLPDVTKLLT